MIGVIRCFVQFNPLRGDFAVKTQFFFLVAVSAVMLKLIATQQDGTACGTDSCCTVLFPSSSRAVDGESALDLRASCDSVWSCRQVSNQIARMDKESAAEQSAAASDSALSNAKLAASIQDYEWVTTELPSFTFASKDTASSETIEFDASFPKQAMLNSEIR